MSKQIESALFSQYVIDGVKYEISPAELLNECSEHKREDTESTDLQQFKSDIVDESREPSLSSFKYDPAEIETYAYVVSESMKRKRAFNMICPEHFTKLRTAGALIDFIWNKGHFRLGDLCVSPNWKWNMSPVGNMAAFYKSAETLNSYLYDLGVKILNYDFATTDTVDSNEQSMVNGLTMVDSNGQSMVNGQTMVEEDEQSMVNGLTMVEEDGQSMVNEQIKSDELSKEEISPIKDSYLDISVNINDLNNKNEDNEWDETFLFKSSPYESRHPRIGCGCGCASTTSGDPEKWIIYIPFDPCRFRTGGSLLASAMGDRAGMAPEVGDPDYFIDCYEVVRELVEDGMISAGVTIADGGLAAGLLKLSNGCGLSTDFRGILSSYQETNPVNILFGEVPGVLVEIDDENFDYFDSQLLLQDVAYYPLGHPAPEKNGKIFGCNEKTDTVANILASLLVQASEGED